VLRTIEEEGLLAKCEADGDFLRAGLHELQRRHGLIREVRGRGLMIAIELDPHPSISYAGEIFARLFARRIIVLRRPGVEVLRIDPALTVERADLDRFLGAMEEILFELG
jgi:4-aminobutyrate aminotransferase-like enzyme